MSDNKPLSSYTLIRAISLTRSYGADWETKDLSNVSVASIFETYLKVYLVLTNSVLVGEIYVDLGTLKAEFAGYTGTLNDLIAAYGDRAFVTTASLPVSKLKRAIYSDAFRAEYKVELADIGKNHPANYPLEDLHDLRLTRPSFSTDLTLIHSHCLVSVNGFFHQTDTDGTSAYVYAGADTMRKSRNNNLGFTSFLEIGKLNKSKINPINISTSGNNSTLVDRVRFSVEEDMTGKTFMLVLGGYLIIPEDGVFYQTSDNDFTLDLSRIPFLERIFESRNFIDLSSLELELEEENAELASADLVFSEATILKYFALSQSFFVSVESENLLFNQITIRHSPMPGMFTSYQDPKYPLFIAHGRLAEYWKVFEDEQWSVTVSDSFLRNYVFSQQPLKTGQVVNDNLLSYRPFSHSRGYLLEISGFSN